MMARVFLISLLISALSLALVDGREPPSDTYRSNRGPLTTQFVPPSTCFNEVRTSTWRGFIDLEVGCEGPGGNECCPELWGRKRYFSPGVCPSGYQTCTMPSSRQRQETTNLCCPDNFDCATDVNLDCVSSLNTPIPTVATYDGTTTSRTLYAVYATNIQIRYQASDSDVVPVPTENNLPGIDDGSLSPAEKGGIAVGVILGVLALGGAGYFLGRRHKRKQAYNDITLQDGASGPAPAVPDTISDPPPAYPGKQ